MREFFTPIDIIAVVRHNKTLQMGNYRKAADEGNFYLRGFNYLFIMQKPEAPKPEKKAKVQKADEPKERNQRTENKRPYNKNKQSNKAKKYSYAKKPGK